MLLPVSKMPRYEMYWNSKTQYETIASTLPLKQYKKVCEFLHTAENIEKKTQKTKTINVSK